MEDHVIDIEIGKDGTVRAKIMGAKGKGCLAYAELLEKIVGTLHERELTSEYYEPETPVHLKPPLENRQER